MPPVATCLLIQTCQWATSMAKKHPRIRVGERLRNIRIIAGRSQQDVAASAGIRQSTLSNIETGKCDGKLETLGCIAVALGKDFQAIVCRGLRQ